MTLAVEAPHRASNGVVLVEEHVRGERGHVGALVRQLPDGVAAGGDGTVEVDGTQSGRELPRHIVIGPVVVGDRSVACGRL